MSGTDGAGRRLGGLPIEEVVVVERGVVRVLDVAQVVLADKGILVVEVLGEQRRDAVVAAVGREAGAAGAVRDGAVGGEALVGVARKVRAEQIRAETAVAVARVALDATKELLLGAEGALLDE